IILNLLSNAVKFTPAGGRVEIRVAPGDESEIRIAVTDTGIGIEEEELESIFSEFHQAPSARQGQVGGTGIGLALTRRLVELHGGSIGVESRIGQGSTFQVLLPKREVPAGARHAPMSDLAPSENYPTGRRILVAEDNEVNLALILDMLSVHGHATTIARNGREAVEQARQVKPELIFMDVRMPVMDGLQATRAIREMPEFADLPIIALTASTGPEAETRHLEAGMTEHLAKPIQAEEMFAVLRKYLGGGGPVAGA
ncbi:MAG: response regulator, partial [SAR324 cluster bacterium]|nr:response regulator [SAR324 cluster bacterium]